MREFECLGACDMAPMASVDGRYVGPLSTDDASEFVAPGEGRRDGAARPRAGGPRVLDPGSGAAAGRAAEHPSVHAAGGEWPDDELDVPPAEGPPPHPKPIIEPLVTGHAA